MVGMFAKLKTKIQQEAGTAVVPVLSTPESSVDITSDSDDRPTVASPRTPLTPGHVYRDSEVSPTFTNDTVSAVSPAGSVALDQQAGCAAAVAPNTDQLPCDGQAECAHVAASAAAAARQQLLIEQLRADNARLNAELESLLLRNAQLQQTNDELWASKTQLLEQTGALLRTQSRLENEISELQSHLAKPVVCGHQAIIDSLQSEKEALTSKLAEKDALARSAERKLTDMKKLMRQSRRADTPPAAVHTVASPRSADSTSHRSSQTQTDADLPSPPPTGLAERRFDAAAVVKGNRLKDPLTCAASLAAVSFGADLVVPGTCVSPVAVAAPTVDPLRLSEEKFQYLRHVVLKYMLSHRDGEAVHLVKAIAMLLRFSGDEQLAVLRHLQWRASWFGLKPPSPVAPSLL